MRITKYPQSCLVVEDGDGRVLIDAGTFAFNAYTVDDFGHIDAALFTHRHPDHLDPEHVGTLRERGIELYGNDDVCELLGDAAHRVEDGGSYEVAGFPVVALDLPHVPLVDGSPGPPNTGFVVDGTLFHPGDSIEDPQLRAQVLAAPIVGPSISFRDAYVLAEQVEAETVVPIHYDFFTADPDLFAHVCDIAEVVVLAHGESVEVGR